MSSTTRTTLVLWSIGALLVLCSAGSGSVVILADDSGSAAAGLSPDQCLLHGEVVQRADVPAGQECDQPAPEGDSTPAPPPPADPVDPTPPADPSTTPEQPAPDAGATPPAVDPGTSDPASTPETPAVPAAPTASNAEAPDTPASPATETIVAPADTAPTDPAAPSAADPQTPGVPVADQPKSPDLPLVPDFDRRTKSTAEDEEGFVDARTFRATFNPAGRIPDLPQLSDSGAMVFAANAHRYNTSWSVLAAIAWLDDQWDSGSTSAKSVSAAAKTLRAHAQPGHPYAGLQAYFKGNPSKVRRARYLADYYDAVGLPALTNGLNDKDAQSYLIRRALADRRLDIYGAGRDDVKDGVVDPRVLVTLEFLANRYDSVKICSLVSGHSVFTKSGNISNHSKGQAADVCALGGVAIFGHQQANSVTVKAVKDLLQMPVQMDTEEIITLWAFGLPSFALPDHDDHIHVGFDDPSA